MSYLPFVSLRFFRGCGVVPQTLKHGLMEQNGFASVPKMFLSPAGRHARGRCLQPPPFTSEQLVRYSVLLEIVSRLI